MMGIYGQNLADNEKFMKFFDMVINYAFNSQLLNK